MATYAEYLAKAKQQKLNPELLAPSAARAPRGGTAKSKRVQPPLDMGYHKTENNKYRFRKAA